MKKLLSIVLSLALLVAAMPLNTVFADGKDTSATDKLEQLKEWGAVKGSEKGFTEEEELSRKRAALFAIRFAGKEDEAKKFAKKFKEEGKKSSFTDVEGYFAPFIEYAKENKLFKGVTDEKFNPEGSITTQQFAMVMLRALGYGDTPYKEAYEKATELGILDGIEAGKKDPIVCMDAYVGMYNGMHVTVNGSDKPLWKELGYEKELAGDMTVKATAADELTIEFAEAVDTKDIVIEVTRGKSTKVVGETTWNKEGTVATFKTAANMIAGTYKVAVKSKSDESFSLVGEVKVEKRKNAEIVILNKVALTGKTSEERDTAYVYYDVYDQYGNSIKDTTSITWSSSVGGNVPNSQVDRAKGQIKLIREEQQFVFGEKIFINGVDSRTGTSKSATLEVGQPRGLDKIKIAGFLKKGTTKILEQLPSGFKKETYYLLFKGMDQNGNEFTEDVAKNDITFITHKPTVIEKIEAQVNGDDIKQMVVDGKEYFVALVKPGINVYDGGEEFKISAISTKTGTETEFITSVKQAVILDSFTIIGPVGNPSEGKAFEIEFAAAGKDGEPITDFQYLARQKNMNALSFNSGDSNAELILYMKDDGSAGLKFQPKQDVAWTESETTDGRTRPVSITSIVTGGTSDNYMLQIDDKSRPVAIKKVKMDNVLLKNSEQTFEIKNNDDSSFVFIDQYGDEMDDDKANEFFKESLAGHLNGLDFDGYHFCVKVTYKGDNDMFKYDVDAANNAQDLKHNKEFYLYDSSAASKKSLKIIAQNKSEIKQAKTGMSLKFEVVKHKNDEANSIAVSSKKLEDLTIVDITALKNYSIKDISKVYVKSSQSNEDNGQFYVQSTVDRLKNSMTKSDVGPEALNSSILAGYQETVKVIGQYNGEDVTVPSSYMDYTSAQLTTDASGKITGIKNLVSAAGVKQVETLTVTYDTAPSGGSDIVVVTLKYGSEADEKVTVDTQAIDNNANNDAIATAVKAAIDTKTNANAEHWKDFDFTISNNAITMTAKKALADNTDLELSINDKTGSTNIFTSDETSANTTQGAKAGQQIGFMFKDFYSSASPYLRKDASAAVKATIKNVTASGDDQNAKLNSAVKSLKLSDAAPYAFKINAPLKFVANPTNTSIDGDAIENGIKKVKDFGDGLTVEDQYGRTISDPSITYKISKVEENKNGYAMNNFKVTNNDSSSLSISGAECGDKFTLEISCEKAKLSVEVTVGGDTNATIVDSVNKYLDTLIKTYLEPQRVNSL